MKVSSGQSVPPTAQVLLMALLLLALRHCPAPVTATSSPAEPFPFRRLSRGLKSKKLSEKSSKSIKSLESKSDKNSKSFKSKSFSSKNKKSSKSLKSKSLAEKSVKNISGKSDKSSKSLKSKSLAEKSVKNISGKSDKSSKSLKSKSLSKKSSKSSKSVKSKSLSGDSLNNLQASKALVKDSAVEDAKKPWLFSSWAIQLTLVAAVMTASLVVHRYFMQTTTTNTHPGHASRGIYKPVRTSGEAEMTGVGSVQDKFDAECGKTEGFGARPEAFFQPTQ